MKRRKTLLTCSLLLVGLVAAVCLLGALGYLACRRILPPIILGRRDAARPTVAILAPQHGEQVTVASNIVVQVEGRVLTGQVVLLQLWADGELVGARSGAATQLNAQWIWLPRTAGDHTLIARAYNTQHDAGVTMVRVVAVEAADADRDGVPDQADTCSDRPGLLQLDGCPPGMAGGTPSDNPEAQEIADAWVGPGEEATEEAVAEAGGALGGESGDADGDGVADADDRCPDQPGPADDQGCPRTVSGGGPGTIQGSQVRPQIDDSDFPPGEFAIEENCRFCDWQEEQGGTYGDVELSGVGLEVEVLSLRTAEGLSDVACYARLQSSQWERVPGDQEEFFAPLEGGFWNVADYLGSEHGRGVTVPEGEPLRLQVRCYGRLGDMLTPSLHLGEVTREHGPADWNGQTFTARGQEGANWFDLSYRICGIPCEENVIPPPYDLRLIRNEGYVTSYTLAWRWDGYPAAIDGFHIYRDGNYIDFSDVKYTFLSQSTAEPGCSDEYRFEVRAYKGTQESAPSNPAFSPAPFSCRDRNELEVSNVILPTPQRADLVVDLNYWYNRDHGRQVHVFVLPLQGNRPPCWMFQGCPVEFHDLFSLATATVEPGAGNTRVHVYYGGAEPMVTDGLRLVMMDEDNEWFYMRDVPLNVQWYPSGPDLAWGDVDIFSPARQVEGQTMRDLYFQVVNRGYARLLWTPSLNIRLGNGQLAIPTEDWDDVWLAPGGSTSIVWSVPEDVWLALAPTYEVTLDPANVIAELNEGNNTFRGSTQRLRVRFNEVFTHHPLEESYFYIGLNGRFQVGYHGQRPLGALAFRGGAHDEWVDNWGENDLFLCHEEGLALQSGWDYDVKGLFDAINSEIPYCVNDYAVDDWLLTRTGVGIGNWPRVYRTEWPFYPFVHPPNTQHEREEWCRHLSEQGYAPEDNYIDILASPNQTLYVGVHLDELDVKTDWFGCSDHYDMICEGSQDILLEQLQNLPLNLEIRGSYGDDHSCSMRVTIEEVPNP